MILTNSLLLQQLVKKFLDDYAWMDGPEGWRESCDQLAEALGEKPELTELEKAGIELAEYTSYAEIVGGVSVNRPIIRKWCDIIYEQIRQINRERFEAEVYKKKDATGDIDDIHFTPKPQLPSAGDGW